MTENYLRVPWVFSILLSKALQSEVVLHQKHCSLGWAHQFLVQSHQLGMFQGVSRRELDTVHVDTLAAKSFRAGDIKDKLYAHYQDIWVKEGQGSRYTVGEGRADTSHSVKRFQDYIWIPSRRSRYNPKARHT